MQAVKEKLNPSRLLLFSAYGVVFCAVGFSIVENGSYAIWRKSILQTLIFTGFFFYLLSRQISGKKMVDRSALDIHLLVLLGYVTAVFIFAQSRAVAFHAVIQFLSCVCAFYVFVSMAKRRSVQVGLVGFVGFITLILCIYGLLIHFGIFLFQEWHLKHFFQKGMLCASFYNHNHMAGWLEMAMLLSAGLFFARRRSVPLRMLMAFGFVIMLVTQVLTLSRGGWIAAGAGGMFMLLTCVYVKEFHTPKMLLPVTAVIGIILALGVLGSSRVVDRGLTLMDTDIDRTSGRIRIWKGTMQMINAYPITGVGPGNHSLILPQFQPPGIKRRFYHAHNDYLQFTAELGLLFIPLVIWTGAGFFRAGFKKLRHPSRQTRWITLGAMGGIVAILVHSVTDFNLQFPSNALLFTLLAAQVAAPPPPLKQ